MIAALASHVCQRLTRRFRRLGTATVSFGKPLSLAGFLGDNTTPPTEAVAAMLMARLAAAVPILPVPLVARLLLAAPGQDRAALEQGVRSVLTRFAGGKVPLPRRSAAQVTDDGLTLLRTRRLLAEAPDGGIAIAPGAAPVLAYYAASIAHHFSEAG